MSYYDFRSTIAIHLLSGFLRSFFWVFRKLTEVHFQNVGGNNDRHRHRYIKFFTSWAAFRPCTTPAHWQPLDNDSNRFLSAKGLHFRQRRQSAAIMEVHACVGGALADFRSRLSSYAPIEVTVFRRLPHHVRRMTISLYILPRALLPVIHVRPQTYVCVYANFAAVHIKFLSIETCLLGKSCTI